MKIKNSTLKNILLGGILVFGLFFFAKSTIYVSNLKDLRIEKNSLVKQNKELSIKVDSLHNVYIKLESSYIKLDSDLDNNLNAYKKLKLENQKLQLKLTDLENEIANISTDSSYNYLMHRYIPTQDSLPYGFAPNQIKSIHYDVLFLDNTKLINNNLNNSLLVADSLYLITTSKFNICREQTSILLTEKQLLSNSIDNLESINKIYKKKLNNQRFISFGLGTGIVGYITYVIIKAVKND